MRNYADYIENVIPEILKSVFILLEYKEKEIVKAVIEFAKVALGLLDAEFFKSFLPALVSINYYSIYLYMKIGEGIDDLYG